MFLLFLVLLTVSCICPPVPTAAHGPDQSLEHGTFQVLRIVPENAGQVQFLHQLWNSSDYYNLDFWKAPWKPGALVDVMVPPSMTRTLEEGLRKEGIQFLTIIKDVEKLIQTRENKESDFGFDRLLRDDGPKAFYNFRRYQSTQKMMRYMEDVAAQYPDIARTVSIGTTHEGRPIKVIKIGSPITNVRKKAVWVDGGIHAREWAASHVAVYFIHKLVTNYNRDPQITFFVNSLNWYIAPMVNPDGYEYTRSKTHPSVRLWRKNRGENGCKSGRSCCRGVDLNRNFDFFWGEAGSSKQPCNEVYAGPTAFSEPESRAIRDFIMPRRRKIGAFITLHTYSQIWVHSFGHARNDYPDDVGDLKSLGIKAAKALRKLYGTKYVVGSGADTLYPASGGSDDWAKDKAGIKYVYLLELRPDEKAWDGFILDESELLPTSKETFAGVAVVAEEVLRRQGITRRPSTTRPPTTTRRTFKPLGGRNTSRPAVCSDKRYACQRWTSKNKSLCRTVRYFMREQCSKSCNFC